MRVLGIDPGIARLGWGVILEVSGEVKPIAYGCFTTDKRFQDDQRLQKLFSQINKVIKKYQPEVLAIEDLFFAANAKTALQVGQARGIVLLAAALAGLKVNSYTPLKIKLSLVGYGRAEKYQVQQMVETLLRIKEKIKIDDTADALAVALTHCYLYKLEQKLK
ncbi:crossover junction endodeoxyribonuclease RuvC [Candidatus Beckwithbacteria bacterium RBG_13_42_9]|uniref:Crossover junction endodeoxyribonuclease RuvC n=1 Tax=Candidatus Beckwithbacteria bacterium RBG_13_42_9 TaxID=1797457 RepID=A0A1F5E7U1_9BACT|nr:MAG: crossover junction endodeoxyribonuclease RuvC [Candidatus Beckwithbacteria bacterium RBG_13_42_9]